MHNDEKFAHIFVKIVKMKTKTEIIDPLSHLGKELRSVRRAQGLTLQALADLSDKSVSFLSKIERGRARPSVTALQDIASALGFPVGWFFENDGPVPADERRNVVRASRRRRLSYSGVSGTDYMGFQDHLLSASLDGSLALGISHYEPDGSTGDDLYTHIGEEAGLVVEGEIELTLGKKTFLLKTGDSFSFSADTPHRFRNPGESRAAVVWANTPVSLRKQD